MTENKFSELPKEFRKTFEAEKIRDCILVSLSDELTDPKVHLDTIDIEDIIRDAIDIPINYIKSNYKSKYWDTYSQTVKTSRILEQFPLHDFTKKSLNKCGIYIPFPE